jgi:spermidine synthase
MTPLLHAVFFLSGVSALTFETLWFHQAGLALGNSVWASSLVLAGFMGGLGLGNGLAAWHGDRVARPVRLYAALEVVIGVSGVALVYGLPLSSPLLGAVLRPLLDTGWALNALRLGAAFALLLVPSTAMGLTLPLLTRALTANSTAFGGVLGRLYGWNTLGAVVGAVAAETLWIGAVGIRGTAWGACALSLLAAAGASAAARVGASPRERGAPTPPLDSGALPWLAAAFAFGFALLALEVVWFRFLALFVYTHTVAFALMLGVVLCGIGLGSFAAGRALRGDPSRHRWASPAAFLCTTLCVSCYAVFPWVLPPPQVSDIRSAAGILLLSTALMLPVSLLSGALFPLVGAALREHLHSEARTTGALTLANTVGAALGALAGGFVLLPGLGIERSLFALGVVYAATGLLLALRTKASRLALGTPFVVALASLALFPDGAMETRFLPAVRDRLSCPHGVAFDASSGRAPARMTCDVGAVTVREGLVETIQYVVHERFGRPHYYRLVTDSYSMSGTPDFARRYMKLYVYLPVALRPEIRESLLISFGVGSTARALASTPYMQRVDVVDISPEILELASVVFPESENPLRDPRVHVHVEDGRYFLQTTERRFDLVTAEPPPPGAAGVVNLYTREYFSLVRERLTEGGVATYWLPMRVLTTPAALSIIRAFCEAFTDCTLWNGSGLDLMLMGSRDGAASPPSLESFVRQWNDPAVRLELDALGLERPEQLAALFLGDAAYLRALTSGAEMLVDDRPKRVMAPETEEGAWNALISQWRDVDAAQRRFETSDWVAQRFPEEVRRRAPAWFAVQRVLDSVTYATRSPEGTPLVDVHALLVGTPLVTPIVWLLGSDTDLQRIVHEGASALHDPEADFHRAVARLAQRDFGAAAEGFARAERGPEVGLAARLLRIYALAMAEQTEAAQRLAAGLVPALPPGWAQHRVWSFLKETFGIDPAAPTPEAVPARLAPGERAALDWLPCRALAGHVMPQCWLPLEVPRQP